MNDDSAGPVLVPPVRAMIRTETFPAMKLTPGEDTDEYIGVGANLALATNAEDGRQLDTVAVYQFNRDQQVLDVVMLLPEHAENLGLQLVTAARRARAVSRG